MKWMFKQASICNIASPEQRLNFRKVHRNQQTASSTQQANEAENQ
jgi:hypothetical protein